MSDLIYRDAAIDTLRDMWCKSDEDGYVWIIRSDAWARIDALPAVEPEIIRCKDCRWKYINSCTRAVDLFIHDEDFCSYAERRQDE